MKDDNDVLLRRQKVLADFGDFALQADDLDQVLTEACRLVGQAMGTDRSKVLEISEDGTGLLVRAGVGWGENIVGQIKLPMSEPSSESYSIRERKPVISRDINSEKRFEVPAFMRKAGVVALANVPILLPGGRAYGLLQVDDTRPRDFDQNDSEFLRTYAAILGPIIDRILKLKDLRSTSEQFRFTLEAVNDYAIFLTDPEGRVTDWLPGAAAVYGWQADEIVGKSASILYTPEDREQKEDEKEIETAKREGSAPDVRWHVRKDGERIFIEGTVRRLQDSAGAAAGLIKIGQDVTERHRWQQRQEVLVAELQHRTLNLMGVVRSVAEQTASTSLTVEGFMDNFRQRIAALVRVQGLLSKLHDGERVTFKELIENELVALAGHNRDNVSLNGPDDIKLRSRSVQILALALHELGTNALKYGALCQAGGRLCVHWEKQQHDGKPWLHIDWKETEITVPLQGSVPEGGGAGRDLIDRALPYQLGARTTYVIGVNGIHCTITIPC